MLDTGPVILTFHRIYPSLNRILRMSRWERVRLKRAFMDACRWELRAVVPYRFPGKVRIEINLCFKDRLERPRDPDNYQPKWLLDCLVKEGVIKDDSWKIVGGGADVRFISGDPRDHVDVRITDARGDQMEQLTEGPDNKPLA